MLLDPAECAFTKALERNLEVFRSEFDQLGRDDVPLWPDRAAYGGDWRVAPLFMSSHRPGIEEQFARKAKCPRSTACLRAISGVTAAAFSWMEPGSHIYAHRDVKAIEVLRAHLPLEAPVGARMQVAADVHTWRRTPAGLAQRPSGRHRSAAGAAARLHEGHDGLSCRGGGVGMVGCGALAG